MWKLIKVPSTQENTDTTVATISMRSKLRHSMKAMMPGAINIAITRMTPTACNEATIVSASRHSSP
ncbi:hypothetical protein D3C76_1562640 [compost metagenome]